MFRLFHPLSRFSKNTGKESGGGAGKKKKK